MRDLGKQIGLGIALVFSVALVTLLFTFLGTIASAALVGLMAGATRQWRWQIVPVSFVFPGVIAAFMHFTKTNLTPQQNFVLPLVCFGAFWLTYLLTCALGYFEKRDNASGEPPAMPAAKMEPGQPAAMTNTAAQYDVTVAPLVNRKETSCASGLAELQGTWSRETPGVNGQACQKVIEVVRDKLAMSLVGLDGAHVVCQGDVRLERLGSFKILKVLGPPAGAWVASAEHPNPETWIYRITGQRLVLASNLETSADDRDSTIETYVKLRDAG